MSNIDDIVEQLNNLTVVEALELVKILEGKWGVSATPLISIINNSNIEEKQEDKQTEFDVVINSFGTSKIDVIKIIRQITSLGLKDAKDLAETPGGKIVEGVDKETAINTKNRFALIDAIIEIK